MNGYAINSRVVELYFVNHGVTMNQYDDLQQFKDKTRTQNLDFKDLSTQTTAHERGDWSILEQLSPSTDEASSLAIGGSVSQVVPQPVAADAFVSHEPPVQPAMRDAPAQEPRAATSIMQSVSTQMTPPAVEHAAPQASIQQPAVQPTPAIQPPTPRVIAAPPAPQPVARRPEPAATTESTSYSHLFAPKTAEAVGKEEKQDKDQPLKSLLERIASCR